MPGTEKEFWGEIEVALLLFESVVMQMVKRLNKLHGRGLIQKAISKRQMYRLLKDYKRAIYLCYKYKLLLLRPKYRDKRDALARKGAKITEILKELIKTGVLLDVIDIDELRELLRCSKEIDRTLYGFNNWSLTKFIELEISVYVVNRGTKTVERARVLYIKRSGDKTVTIAKKELVKVEGHWIERPLLNARMLKGYVRKWIYYPMVERVAKREGALRVIVKVTPKFMNVGEDWWAQACLGTLN